MQFAKQIGGLVIGRDTFAISWGGFFWAWAGFSTDWDATRRERAQLNQDE